MTSKFGFPTSSPEQQGVSSSAILSFIEEIEKQHIEVHGLIIMRHGHIITEGYWSPFSAEKSHRLFSAGKALMSTAILFAIQEGFLKLDDLLVDLLPNKVPVKPSEKLCRITLYHLLTMTTGHKDDPFGAMRQSEDRAKCFYEQEIVYEPGTHFMYNNGVPDMLSFILYEVTGQNVMDYLKPRLFEPTEMTGMRAEMNGIYTELPTMSSTTWDLMKLALIYANSGKWQGKQLLDPKLIAQAGSYLVPSLQDPVPPMVAYDTKFGYGYQIWRNSVGGFRIDGGRGQFGIVIPEMDLVAAINSNETDQGIIPVLFWEKITNKLYAVPLDEDNEDYLKLCNKLKKLTIAPKYTSRPNISYQGSYAFDCSFLGCNVFNIGNAADSITITTNGEEENKLTIGSKGRWTQGRCPFEFDETKVVEGINLNKVTGYNPKQILSTGGWLSENTFQIMFRSDGWMGGNILTLKFEEDRAKVTYEGGNSYNLCLRSEDRLHPLLKSNQWIHSTTAYAHKIK
jgi:CubicO group peptidase (beta-lactamase class C family)